MKNEKYKVAKKVVEALTEEEIRLYLPTSLAVSWQLASVLPSPILDAIATTIFISIEKEDVSLAKKLGGVAEKINNLREEEKVRIAHQLEIERN